MRLLLLCSLILAAALLAGCEHPTPPPASVPLADAAHPGATPAADPAPAVLEASRRFASLRSFHAEMTLHGAQAGQVVRSGMDFVAPDRYRLDTPAGVQTIIGDTFFLQAEGRMQQVPLPAGTLEQWRNPLPSEASLQDLQVDGRGPGGIDGTGTRVYRIDGPAGSGETLQYWIGGDGLPRQIQRDGFNKQQPYRITLRYSRLNDPTLQVPPPGDAAPSVLNGDL